MSPTEAIPLLVVVLLMISIGGGDVQDMSVTFEGDNDVEALADVHVVAGGTTTVPGNATVDGDIYVIGGTAGIDGTVDGDVTLLNGNLSINDVATVTGTLQTYSGSAAVSSDASVGQISRFEAPTPSSSPVRRIGGFLLQFLVLGAFGWWLVERHPLVMENVGAAVTDHALVSGIVGSLGATSLLVLFVYMAFTLILLPVAIIGLLAEFLVILYGHAVFGYLIGTRLPVERDGVATIAGIAVFLLAFELRARAVPRRDRTTRRRSRRVRRRPHHVLWPPAVRARHHPRRGLTMYTTLHDPTTNYPLRNALAMVTSHHTVRRHVPFANRIVDLDLLDAHPETEPVNYYTLSVTTIASPSRRV